MTKRERVIKAIQHQQTDFAPYFLEFTDIEYSKVAEYLGDKDFINRAGSHIDIIGVNGFRKEDPPGSNYYTDDFGVGWDYKDADNDIIHICGSIIKEPDMKTYKMPEVNEEKLREKLEALVNNGKDTAKMINVSFSLFERAWVLRGMSELLEDMLLEPDFVHEFLEAITEYNLKLLDIALEYNLDAVFFGDDWGQQKGMIMGPALWRKFIKPRMAKLFNKVKSADRFTVHHSCGDVSEIFSDLIEIGLDMYQTFQPEIYDIKKVKQEYGKDLGFWGAISTQRLLPFAAPEEVKKVTREIIKIVGKDGGFIVAPTHTIPHDVSPENVVALIEAFRNQKG